MSEASNRVTLRVGERLFYTTKDTLTGESTYFKARFSKWNDADDDGSYFIDGDPVLFQTILQYLRSGILPLFFEPVTQTHDLAKYAAILGEARYYGINKLEAWILDKHYLQVVQTHTVGSRFTVRQSKL